MKNRIAKIAVSLVLAVGLILQIPVPVAADDEMQERLVNTRVYIDSVEKEQIRAVNYNYKGNIYVSLRGAASALSGTDKAFTVSISKEMISIQTGSNAGTSTDPWTEDELADSFENVLKFNKMEVNGREKGYTTLKINSAHHGLDAYIAPVDLAMLLDCDIQLTGGALYIDTTQPFFLSPMEMEESGLFQGINAFLIGDATTGDIYYSYQADTSYPIASTTKLMTYLLVAEAIEEGRLSMDTPIMVDREAHLLADSPDGEFDLEEGMLVSVRDLLYGMLIVSSNECTYMLGKGVGGDADTFVEMMNKRAADLGLSATHFYNPHGLPAFQDNSLLPKVQNYMSAEDMFVLSTYLLNYYPQITDITSQKKATFYALDKEITNNNKLLYQMPEVTGLKTGTTNKSGCCLVSSLDVKKDGEKHSLVVVLFGAEGSAERIRFSEIGARYAKAVCLAGDAPENQSDKVTSKVIPQDPEVVMQRLMSIQE